MSKTKLQKYSENISWIRNNEVIFESNVFIYESNVYLYQQNRFSLINKSYYKYSSELPIVSSFWKSSNIEICCNLYAAPKNWLINNNFKLNE